MPQQYRTATPTAGKPVFATAGCTGCHTLKDAGATGTVGPNLDQAQPDAVARRRARHARAQGAMPPFKGQLSDKQIADVAAYVVQATGGTGWLIELPDDFPRDVAVVATDFDRTLVWEDGVAAAAHARRAARARATRGCT